MRSFSATGGTQLTVQFDLGKNIDAAAGAIQAAINAAGPSLPKDMPQPPGYWKANPSGWSVITLALTSDVLDPSDVYDIADTIVAEQISQVPGVARIYISGAERGAVRIRVDPGRIAAMHVSLEQIRAAVRDATLNLPKGRMNLDGQFWSIADNDQLFKARGISRHRRGLAQRRTRAAARCRRGNRRRGQRAAGRLVQQRAWRRHPGLQAAGCQHRGDGRCREGSCCRSSSIGCRRR